MRRLRLLTVLLSALAAAPGLAAAPTGMALPGLEPFDREIAALMDKWEVPGASLAVARDGRLMLARGYGWADRGREVAATPQTLFRLGSLAKPITAVAVLQLADEGRLRLDDRVVPLLGPLGPRPDRIRDPRVMTITVRQLLQHTAGFDRTKSGDVVFMPGAAAAAARQNTAMPASCETVMRDTLEGRLDFDPGTRHAYSNIGYCILGRVVERAAGQPYERFVRERLFAPVGATGFRLARTLEAAQHETLYYDYPGAAPVDAMPGLGLSRVARPYGAYAMEAMDSYGGWIGAPLDFLRFMLAIDGQRGGPLLRDSLPDLFARPEGLERTASYYGLGFLVKPVTGGRNWWHGGSLAGTKAFALRTAQGYAWVATFNSRPRDRERFAHDIDVALWRAARAVKTWPPGDLFSEVSKR